LNGVNFAKQIGADLVPSYHRLFECEYFTSYTQYHLTMKNTLFALCAILLLSATALSAQKAKGKSKPSKAKSAQAATAAPRGPVKAGTSNEVPVPMQTNMEPDSLVGMFMQVTSLDFLFDNNSMTMNMEGENAKSTYKMFASKAPQSQHCAKKLCTMIYSCKGGHLADADVYLANGCAYFEVKYKGERYAHAISQDGLNFFQQILEQTKKGAKSNTEGH